MRVCAHTLHLITLPPVHPSIHPPQPFDRRSDSRRGRGHTQKKTLMCGPLMDGWGHVCDCGKGCVHVDGLHSHTHTHTNAFSQPPHTACILQVLVQLSLNLSLCSSNSTTSSSNSHLSVLSVCLYTSHGKQCSVNVCADSLACRREEAGEKMTNEQSQSKVRSAKKRWLGEQAGRQHTNPPIHPSGLPPSPSRPGARRHLIHYGCLSCQNSLPLRSPHPSSKQTQSVTRSPTQ